jgi:hypothetical protein
VSIGTKMLELHVVPRSTQVRQRHLSEAFIFILTGGWRSGWISWNSIYSRREAASGLRLTLATAGSIRRAKKLS